MDKSERQRLKQLAIDTIVTYPVHSTQAALAERLEKCVDELEDANAKCPTCSVCENHGDIEDESIEVDAGEILRIHGELKGQVVNLKDLHVKLAGATTGASGLLETLALRIEELEDGLDELQAEVLP